MAVIFLVAGALATASAETWHEGYDSGQPSWKAASGGDWRIAAQDRPRDASLAGGGAERLVITVDGLAEPVLAHDIGFPRVIEDLQIRLWVRAEQPGVRLAARIVLPHTLDTATMRPTVVLVAGEASAASGRWDRLTLVDVPQLVARQVWTLRTQRHDAVDDRDAYVESVLLVLGPTRSATTIWIDELDVAGHVPMNAAPVSAAAPSAPPQVAGPINAASSPATARALAGPKTAARWAGWSPAVGAAAASPWPSIAAASALPGRLTPVVEPARRRVELTGSVLLVDGRPFLPRAVQYRGEPLDALKRLGFNTVWLDGRPNAELLSSATQAGLWVICPPPFAMRADLPDDAAGALVPIGPEFGCVLAWDMGQNLTQKEVDSVRRWTEQVRSADHLLQRPLLCRADGELRTYSRACDVLVLDRRPLGSSLELSDYGQWLQQQSRLARLVVPFWTTLQTQTAGVIANQLQALDASQTPPTSVSEDQLQLLALAAVMAGSRGFLALSESPLTANDPETRRRSAALELLNLQLQMIEPFVAGGSVVGSAESSEPQLQSIILRSDRARLIVPTWLAEGSQWCVPQASTNNISLTVPGIEATNAYRLLPGRLEPLRRKQAAGGARITFDEFGPAAYALLAIDPLVVSSVSRRTAESGARGAELELWLVKERLQRIRQRLPQLARLRPPPTQTATWLAAAEQSLAESDKRMATRDYGGAAVDAERAARGLRLVERGCWQAIAGPLTSAVSSPATTSFDALPWQAPLEARIAAASWGSDLLPGGDVEDLATLARSGWKHYQNPSPLLQIAADLNPAAAHSGRAGLRMAARVADAKNAPAVIEQPPIWISTAPVAVQAGQLVCLHAWVRLLTKIEGSVDGLMVLDSIGGEPLAARVTTEGNASGGWKELTVFRVAPQSGWFVATFALTGWGEAAVDDVSVFVLQQAAGAK